MQLCFIFLLPALGFSTAFSHGADDASPTAIAYVDAALNVMQEHFLGKDKIDWPQLRRETLFPAGGAQQPVETYPAIRFALAKLGDCHSYLQLTPELTHEEKSRQPKLMNPSAMPGPVRRPAFPSTFRPI
jgi:hypothetical protein